MTDSGIGVRCVIELGPESLEEDQVDDVAGDGTMRRELSNFTEVFDVAAPW